MAVNFSAGNKIDVTIPNVTVEQINDDQTSCLVILPDDGTGTKYEFWLPTNDPRVELTLIAPSNWPPQENDVWIVPGVSTPAFVVGDGSGQLFFLTADTIRAEYNSTVHTVPTTVEQALATFGNSLTLLYREPTTT